MIKFRGVSKEYPNGTKALDNVTLDIEKGEFVFIVGASGAGKSTLLKLILKEETCTHGYIEVNGFNLNKLKHRDVPAFRRTLGVVFQDFRLIPYMNAFDNVAFALRVTDTAERDVQKRVPYILGLLGLESKANCMPSEMSGGEQQRVALARALVGNPSMIIADEPTGNVDPQMSQEIVELLTEINKRGTTIVMVTHEHELVEHFNKRVIRIDHGQVADDSEEWEAVL